jgi:chemotaxis protein MotB
MPCNNKEDNMKKALFFPLFAFVLLSGCVSQATYDRLHATNKLMSQEVQSLTSQADNLQTQVKTLTTEVDALKKERDSLDKQKDSLQSRIAELSPKAEKADQLEKATQTYQDLTMKLEKEIQEGQVQIKEMKDRLTMTMVDKILFPSGSTEISKEGKKVLDKVVSILKDIKDKRIQVEGHTDNVPIVSDLKKRYPTNWELSTGRATEVVRYLQEAGSIDPKLLSATGYGEFQPVAPNDTEEGKHKNRRIEIVLLPILK